MPSKKQTTGRFAWRCFLEISGNVWECLEIDFGGFGDCSFLGDVFTGQNMTQPEWWVWKLFLGNVISKSCGKQPDAWGCLLVQQALHV